LNIAYNILVGGTRLEDIEMRRQDESYMDAVGAQRIPDPTTAGDITRRFKREDIMKLMECINVARQRVWKEGRGAIFPEAMIDIDGTIAPTYGECKEGMDARGCLIKRAEELTAQEWKELERKPKYEVKTQERRKPEHVKERGKCDEIAGKRPGKQLGIYGDGHLGMEHKGMVWDIDAQSDTWGTSTEDGVSPDMIGVRFCYKFHGL
jgi:hypothetical protein